MTMDARNDSDEPRARWLAVPPAPALRPYVEAFWFVSGVADYSRERILPNGVTELIINLGPDPHLVVGNDDPSIATPYRVAWLAGIQSGYITIESHGPSELAGVRFRPGGANPFLRSNASDTTDLVLESDVLTGNLLEAVRERLLRARSTLQRIAVLEELLFERIDPAWRPDPIVAAAREALGTARPSIGTLATELGISQRHLARRFHTEIGLSPKRYASVVRFQSALRAVSGRSMVDWRRVALDCGYFDQAHMIKEFRALCGSTPGHFLRQRDPYGENHIVVG
jgi:AraC-like DNA-binding protein